MEKGFIGIESFLEIQGRAYRRLRGRAIKPRFVGGSWYFRSINRDFLEGKVIQASAGLANMFMISRTMVSLLAGSDSAISSVRAARPTSLTTTSP